MANCIPNYIDFHSVENMIHTKIAPMRTIRNLLNDWNRRNGFS